MKNTLILVSIFIFFGCGKSKEKRLEQHANEILNYDTNITIEHKNIIKSIFDDQKYLQVSDISTKTKVLVMQKWKGEIIPYTKINNIMKDRGFEIEFDSKSIDYILCVKTTGVKAGEYTDGSKAWDTKTEIFVIDAKNNNQVYLIASDYQKAPESIKKRRSSPPGSYGASGLQGNKLAELIFQKFK